MLLKYPLISPVLSAFRKPLYRLSDDATVLPHSSRLCSLAKKASFATFIAAVTLANFVARDTKEDDICFMMPPALMLACVKLSNCFFALARLAS